MYNCPEIKRYQNVINQGGHPIALVSIGTALCEMNLYPERQSTHNRMLCWTGLSPGWQAFSPGERFVQISFQNSGTVSLHDRVGSAFRNCQGKSVVVERILQHHWYCAHGWRRDTDSGKVVGMPGRTKC